MCNVGINQCSACSALHTAYFRRFPSQKKDALGHGRGPARCPGAGVTLTEADVNEWLNLLDGLVDWARPPCCRT
jgi:hypothetical protein